MTAQRNEWSEAQKWFKCFGFLSRLIFAEVLFLEIETGAFWHSQHATRCCNNMLLLALNAKFDSASKRFNLQARISDAEYCLHFQSFSFYLGKDQLQSPEVCPIQREELWCSFRRCMRMRLSSGRCQCNISVCATSQSPYLHKDKHHALRTILSETGCSRMLISSHFGENL